MKRYIIDTNCLISYVTDRNVAQQEAIAKFFESAFRYEIKLVIIGNVMNEFVHVLMHVYNIPAEKVNIMFSDLIDSPGISFEHGFLPDPVLDVWPDRVKHYGDAVVGSYGDCSRTEILTFDAAFARELEKLKIAHQVPR